MRLMLSAVVDHADLAVLVWGRPERVQALNIALWLSSVAEDLGMVTAPTCGRRHRP